MRRQHSHAQIPGPETSTAVLVDHSRGACSLPWLKQLRDLIRKGVDGVAVVSFTAYDDVYLIIR